MLGNNKKSIGFNLPLFNNKGGFSAEALAWRTNIIANGGTIADATLQIFDTNFFIPATANGNILNQLDRLNIYCGLVGYEIAARTNIISSSFFVTPVSSPTFDNNGYKSAGTSYLNLNYNLSTQGVKYTRDSASYGYGVKNPPFLIGARPMGAFGGGASRSDCERDSLGSVGSVNSAGALRNTFKPTGYVHFNFYRPNSANIITRTNASETTVASASVARANENVFELCTGISGSPTAPFDLQYHTHSFHGSASLDFAALQTILNNLFTALGI